MVAFELISAGIEGTLPKMSFHANPDTIIKSVENFYGQTLIEENWIQYQLPLELCNNLKWFVANARLGDILYVAGREPAVLVRTTFGSQFGCAVSGENGEIIHSY